MIRRAALLSLAVLAAPLGLATAQARDMLGDGIATSCDTPWVLSAIQNRFRIQARNVLHNDGLTIDRFSRVHQHRLITDNARRPIERRYCGADVHMSDGRKRYVWYLVEDRMGFTGLGDNVEFCVTGLDRWKVYGGRCRVLQ